MLTSVELAKRNLNLAEDIFIELIVDRGKS